MGKAIEKAKAAKEQKGKLMLNPAQSPLTSKQLLQMLQRTPENHIYRRKGKGGQMWDYVTGVYVKKVLNYVFGWMWDFEVTEHGSEGEQVWVLGKLTINTKKGKIIKTQFGRADIKFWKGTKKPLDYGNDLKAATTDALKKCASELGIASDIYGQQEFKDIQRIDKGFKAPENGSNAPAGKMFAGEKEKKDIEKYCRELGYSDPEKAFDFIKKLTKIEYNEKLTKTDSLTIIAALLQRQTAKRNGKKN